MGVIVTRDDPRTYSQSCKETVIYSQPHLGFRYLSRACVNRCMVSRVLRLNGGTYDMVFSRKVKISVLVLHSRSWSQRMWEALKSKKRICVSVCVYSHVHACVYVTEAKYRQYCAEKGRIGYLQW